jgi:hypothetical protein
MASRQSKRRSRAQKRRRHSMRGGRREEEKKDDAAVAPVEDAEKKAEGGLFGMFSGDAKKDEGAPPKDEEVPAAPTDPAPTATDPAPPAEGAEEKKEEGGMFSGIMGKKDAPAPTETKKKGKKRRHGKYYTPKQLKEACKRMSSKKRHHKNRPFPMEKRGPAMMSNPYAFGERPMM